MTERESFNFRELKLHILARQGGVCWNCPAPATELAHRISNSRSNLRKYGKGIVHHILNLVGSCSRCNQLALIDNKPIKVARLVRRIVADMAGTE